MGLVSKEVEVGIGSSNYKHFKDLGYDVCKGESILVDVNYLSKTSRIYVEIECDECNKLLKRTYGDYCRHNHDGKYYCQKCACKLFNRGENNHNYNHSKTQEEREYGRNYYEYAEFVKRVLKRDNYTCKCCGKHDNKMDVHHLYSYVTYKEYRTDDKYAICLCKKCHEAFHYKYGKNDGTNTPEQFYEWLGIAKLELEKYNGELQIAKKVICLETKEIWNSASECGKNICVKDDIVRRACLGNDRYRTIKRKHYMYFDEYKTKTEDEIKFRILNNTYGTTKIIICINTFDVFLSLEEAKQKYFNGKNINISGNLCGKSKYAGMLDNKKLKWMYYDEYSKLINQEYMGNYTY